MASNAAGDALERAENSNSTDVSGQADERAKLVEPADFFRVFDAWVDSKYPCDRRSATQIKVAFRKVSNVEIHYVLRGNSFLMVAAMGSFPLIMARTGAV